MKVAVEKYRKPDGYPSRYWAVVVDGELLAVTLYRKGAKAVAKALTNTDHHVTTLQDSVEPVTIPRKLSVGVATYRTR